MKKLYLKASAVTTRPIVNTNKRSIGTTSLTGVPANNGIDLSRIILSAITSGDIELPTSAGAKGSLYKGPNGELKISP